MNEALSLSKKINLRLVNLVYEQIKFGQWAELIVFTMVVFAIWKTSNQTLLLSWYIVCAFFCIIRYLGTLYYKYSKSQNDSKKWIFLLCMSAFIAGASWGPMGFIFESTSRPEIEVFLNIFLLGGITIAGLFYSPTKYVYIFFLVPSLLPHIVWLFHQNGIYIYVAVGMVIYFFLMLLLSYYINKFLSDGIKFQFENESLIYDLSIAKNELESTNKKLIMDITERKLAAEREKELNRQLVFASRQAGMADVATSVLHNIGNLLNSVNVSANLLQDKLQRSNILNGFIEINQQLKVHKHDFNRYLTEDSQGKNLLNYLSLLEKAIQEEMADAGTEIKRLTNNIQHIKEVVMMQQSFGNVLDVIEPISISEQIDAVINMIGFDPSYIIKRDFAINQPIFTDKVKLLQILANLIRNAKDALMKIKEKKIVLSAVLMPNNFVQIKVIDNGVGINTSDLNKIFTFGFTTKKEGHGFGLHTSALLAKEMGGSLKGTSEGPGRGATFILELPQKKENDHE